MWWCDKVILLVSLTLLDMAGMVLSTGTDFNTVSEDQKMSQSEMLLQREREFSIAKLRESLHKQFRLEDTLSREVIVEDIKPEVLEEYRLLQSVEGGESNKQSKNPPKTSKAQRLFSFKGSGYEVHSNGNVLVSAGKVLQRHYRLIFDLPLLSNDSISEIQLILYQLPILSEHDEWRGILQSVQVSKIVNTTEGRELKLPLTVKLLSFGKEGHQILELSIGEDLEQHTWIRDKLSSDKGNLELEVIVYFSGHLGEIDDGDNSKHHDDYGIKEDFLSSDAGRNDPSIFPTNENVGDGSFRDDAGEGGGNRSSLGERITDTANHADEDDSSQGSQVLNIVPPGIGFSLNESLSDQLPRLVIMTALASKRPLSRRKRSALSHSYCTHNDELCCPRNTTLHFHRDLDMKHVLYPLEIDFTYCRGLCSSVYGPNSPAPRYYEAIAAAKPDVRPCCAPVKTSSLNVITTFGIIKFYNVSALSCKCF